MRMSGRRMSASSAALATLRRPMFAYSLALFLVGVAAVAIALAYGGAPPGGRHGGVLAFFLLFGLFTIEMGYQHPKVGYVSFDRVAQVASILVLGPVDAAWINGLASLLFPWRRLRTGVPFPDVLMAALNNFGLMALMILACGFMYVFLGGPLPLRELDGRSIALLGVLILAMQVVNDLGMAVYIRLRDGQVGEPLNFFAFLVESGSGLAGVLVAIVFNRMEAEVVALLLSVMALGMLALAQFARMRTQLEAIVEERTHRLQDKTRELERLATEDQLTGLFNRRYADDYLEQRIEEFERYGRGFSIALVDLDHFKSVNDTFSHEAGDRVLKEVATILTRRCRETDMVARYGGEEFLLCFPETDLRAAALICEDLRRAVQNADWATVAAGVRVSLSGGLAEMAPGLTRKRLLSDADRKLYGAKDAGRNLVFS